MTTRLEPGDKAPDFTLPTADGGTVRLADLAQNTSKGVIVYFYPAAATPGCTKEACDFRDSLASLQGAGYAVVGISPDKVSKLAKFADAETLTFPLASDKDHATLEAYGAWGEKQNYGKTYVGVVRSTFVVNPDLTVAESFYNVRATGHVARVRKVLGLDD
jgi:peroxiredoxin Q/BCP